MSQIFSVRGGLSRSGLELTAYYLRQLDRYYQLHQAERERRRQEYGIGQVAWVDECQQHREQVARLLEAVQEAQAVGGRGG